MTCSSQHQLRPWVVEELYYAQDNLYDGAEEGEEGGFGAKNAAVTRDGKKTIAQKNKLVRRREQEAAEEANRLKKRQRHDLSNLKHLNAALTEAEVEGKDGRERRDVARAERTLEAPSRLGKHLYEAETAQVLLTEQVTGTYRTLPGCHTLLRDRLKSFQRREMAGSR